MSSIRETDDVLLRADLVAEPLVHDWYAVPLLVSPLTSALLVCRKFVPLLESFVKYPEQHIAASQRPELAGGAFVNLPADSIAAASRWCQSMRSEHADLFEAAAAVAELDGLVTTQAAGESIEPLYGSIPPPLKGMVELTYDLFHRAHYRVVEPFVYRSALYKRSAQAVSLEVAGAVRPFIYSTPRFDRPGRTILRKRFADEAWDVLFSARWAPRPMGELRAAFGDTVWDARDSLFTVASKPTQNAAAPSPGQVRVRYFGHSAVLIESETTTILTDPGIGGELQSTPDHFTFADLPSRLDWVVTTHAHPDHVWLEALLQLRTRIGTVVVPRSAGNILPDISLKLVLEQFGLRVVELAELETLEVEGGSIQALVAFGEHADLNIRCKTSYRIALNQKTIVAMGDANAPEPDIYRRLSESVGRVDLLCVGMESLGAPLTWGYGSFFSKPVQRRIDQSRRLNSVDYARAVPVLETLKPTRVMIYSMGREPWVSHVMGVHYDEQSPQMVGIQRLMEWCHARQIPCERPIAKAELFL